MHNIKLISNCDESGDWVMLYCDDVLIKQGHSISTTWLLKFLSQIGSIEFNEYSVSDNDIFNYAGTMIFPKDIG